MERFAHDRVNYAATQSPPTGRRDNIFAAAVDDSRRLNRLAAEDPRTVLAVLEYWLAPRDVESRSRVDN